MFFYVKKFSEWLIYDFFSLTQGSIVGDSLEFFIYDTIKIFLLLSLLIFTVAMIRSYMPTEKIKQLLGHKHPFVGYPAAALLGIITPFCSCSAIPLFLSFLEIDIPIGVAFTFLVASPMINELALTLLLGLLGIKVTLIYVLSGIAISIAAGSIIAKLNAKKWIRKDILIEDFHSKKTCSCNKTCRLKDKLISSKWYTLSILKKTWLYIVIGIGIGAWIHGYIPTNFLEKYADATKWYDVPLVVLLGIPLYSNSAGIIPLISSLTEKGMRLGTALAFMMAVTSLSTPEFLILKRVMRLKLIALFAIIVAMGIIFTGYLFNLIT